MSNTYDEEYIESDGLRLFVRSWIPRTPDDTRAVVAICHGFNSHSGYYVEYAEQLAARGYAVFALDLRGRGKSDGERFYLSKFSQYVGDVGALVKLAKSRMRSLPVFLLGHSAGGVVSSTYALENQAELAGLICESFAFQVYAPDFALAVLKGLSHLAPHAHVLRLPNAQFSRDPKLVAAMDADPLIANETQPTLTVAEMARADERLKRDFSQITLPVLILHGSKDAVTKPSGSEFFHEHAGSSDKTLLIYDGHFHDLLNDIGKEVVVRDINVWLDARVSRP